MCAYLEREYGKLNFAQSLKSSGLGQLYADLDNRPAGKESFLPAFGQAIHKKIPDVVIQDESGHRKLISPTWWYDCSYKNQTLRTISTHSSNARNLELPLWQEPIRYRRGIAVMTGLGESIFTLPNNKGKKQFLMRAQQPLLFGVLYKQFDDDVYSAGVITRSPQAKFSSYHHKAFPFFIDPSKTFVDKWLSKDVGPDEPEIADLLHNPTWFETLTVQRVKTFSSAELFKDSVPEILEAGANR